MREGLFFNIKNYMENRNWEKLYAAELAAGREMIVKKRTTALEDAVKALESIADHYDYSRMNGCALLGSLKEALENTKFAIVNLAVEASDDDRERMLEILDGFGLKYLIE